MSYSSFVALCTGMWDLVLEIEQNQELSVMENLFREKGIYVLVPAQSSVTVGLVTDSRPYRLELVNFASSFIDVIHLLVGSTPNNETFADLPFTGSVRSSWEPENGSGLVVDDLELNKNANESFYTNVKKRIERFDFAGAWGGSRKTFIYSEHSRTKYFQHSIELPRSSLWRIEFHVPDIRGVPYVGRGDYRDSLGKERATLNFVGKYVLALTTVEDSFTIPFEVEPSDFGWKLLAEKQLSAGFMDVRLSPNNAKQSKLFFDALRFVN